MEPDTLSACVIKLGESRFPLTPDQPPANGATPLDAAQSHSVTCVCGIDSPAGVIPSSVLGKSRLNRRLAVRSFGYEERHRPNSESNGCRTEDWTDAWQCRRAFDGARELASSRRSGWCRFGQGSTETIYGTITDTTSAVIPESGIETPNDGTGTVATTDTGINRVCYMPSMTIGEAASPAPRTASSGPGPAAFTSMW